MVARCLLLLVLTACFLHPAAAQKQKKNRQKETITINFMVFGKVTSIQPTANGRHGGLARLATAFKARQTENRNTFLVANGNLFTDSEFDRLASNRTSLYGVPMIETLNEMGVSIALLGASELQKSRSDWQHYLNISLGSWLATNVQMTAAEQPQPMVRKQINSGTSEVGKDLVYRLQDRDGHQLTLGIIGISPTPQTDSVFTVADPIASARQQINELESFVDHVIILTSIDDPNILQELAQLAPVIGQGNEFVGATLDGKQPIGLAPIGTQNAATFQVTFSLSAEQPIMTVKNTPLDSSVKPEANVRSVNNRWTSALSKNLSEFYGNPDSIYTVLEHPLRADILHLSTGPTEYGNLVCQAFAKAGGSNVALALVPASEINYGDYLQGEITIKDIVRMSSKERPLFEFVAKGSLLEQLLNTSLAHRTTPQYLQTNGADQKDDGWYIQEKKLEPSAEYRLIVPASMFSGVYPAYSFLSPKHPEVVKIFPARNRLDDLRRNQHVALASFLSERGSND